MEESFNNVQRFCSLVKLIAFSEFKNTDSALENCNAVAEGMSFPLFFKQFSFLLCFIDYFIFILVMETFLLRDLSISSRFLCIYELDYFRFISCNLFFIIPFLFLQVLFMTICLIFWKKIYQKRRKVS